ncbi:MAG: transposase, partial [Lactobacillales bacterium]|nr:transposase [Lactobacillales bacterium]
MYKNYTMKQVVLPIDLEIIIPQDDICFIIHELVESIPESRFSEFIQETGRPSFHPRMMLKLILCGYTQSVFSGRKIE